jgi:dTDP-glucose 4,6-dehydratase
VGTWLVESFLWANRKLNLGAKAVILSRRPRVVRHECVEYVTGDGVSFSYPDGGFRFVIHAANDQSFNANVQTTERILDFARARGTSKLLFTSSGAVYGVQPPQMTHLPETYSDEPVTPYGRAKLASERMCMDFGAVIARLFAFVGPHLPLDANYAVGNFIGNVLRSEPVQVSGDGTPFRSYLYAADLAIWLWTMLLKGEPRRTYNVGSADAVSIASLAETVVGNTRPDTPVVIAGKPRKDVLPERYVPSVDRAEKELGLRVLIGLGDGIRRTYNWHRR